MAVTYVLMPYCETPDRKPGFFWVKNYYESMGMVVVVQTDNHLPFRRSWAINEAYRKIKHKIRSGDVLVIADADCAIQKGALLRAVNIARSNSKLVIPHNQVCRMTPEQSRDVLDSHAPQRGPRNHWWSDTRSRQCVSGVIVISADSFEKVNGFDEGFVGWGGEDNAFKKICDLVLKGVVRNKGVLFHFFHDVDSERAKNWRYKINNQRYRHYHEKLAKKLAFEPHAGNLRYDNYGIKAGYSSRNSKYFNDTKNTDNYQDNVYKYAYDMFGNILSVCDIGCGSGFKLMKYFEDVETIGVDLPKTIKYTKRKYPDRVWTCELPKDYSAVISSDVIEHLDDPKKIV